MKQDLKLYIDKCKNYYLVSKSVVYCDKCDDPLISAFFMVEVYGKKHSKVNVVCNNCLLKIEKFGVVYVAKYGAITDEVQKDFTPIFITPPNISESKGNVSVFDIAEISSEETTNKTIYAGRESLEGACIGLSVAELEVQEKKRLEGVEKLFLEHKRGVKR